ncbi:hypothetical protein BpHYR1_051723 [Brachionus plicatilis]|uniref:Uncharacterized protein n=1 Tax=Brachionus plicatilis TaxID=10195 RepID=A0A3M7PLA5_BRAPC|nr:hypothetical protein BpHYR1_051723 [Brachionus plicatilis]
MKISELRIRTHEDDYAVAMITTIATEMKKKEERANKVILAVPKTKLVEPNGEAKFPMTDLTNQTKTGGSCTGNENEDLTPSERSDKEERK